MDIALKCPKNLMYTFSMFNINIDLFFQLSVRVRYCGSFRLKMKIFAFAFGKTGEATPMAGVYIFCGFIFIHPTPHNFSSHWKNQLGFPSA